MVVYLLLLITITAVTGGQHSASFKSICSADRECSRYSPNQHCAVRCRGLVTRFWNDTAGLPDATISRYYQPQQTSGCYGDISVERCLSDVETRIRTGDSCRRADLAVSCYDRRSVGAALQFIPFTNVELVQNLQQCLEILDLSPTIVYDIARSGILSSPEARCLFRCFLIRSGLYSDEEGPIGDRVNVQCISSYGEEYYVQNVESCLARLRSECGLDKCSLASRAVVECLQVDLEVDFNSPNVGILPYGVDFFFIKPKSNPWG